MEMRTRLLKVLGGEEVDTTPIWLMRQAGRYLPGYRKLRETHGIMEIAKTPSLAAEATLEPLNLFDLDAAIVFADIVHPLEGLGFDVRLDPNTGPVVERPVRYSGDLERLSHSYDAVSANGFVGRTIDTVRERTDRPVLGFSASPFTLACYLIEGSHRRDFPEVRRMLDSSPDFVSKVIKGLTPVVAQYLKMQVRSGASAVQIFDTWAGILSEKNYAELVLPNVQEVVASLHVPTIYFSTNSEHLLALQGKLGATAIGVDWRVSLRRASELLGERIPLQGNLDPEALLGSAETMRAKAADVLKDAEGLKGHIFNLGHGVLPGTPPQRVYELVEFVHSPMREA